MNNFIVRMLTIIIACSIFIYVIVNFKIGTAVLFSLFGITSMFEYNNIIQVKFYSKIISNIIVILLYSIYILVKFDVLYSNDHLRVSSIIILTCFVVRLDDVRFVWATIAGIIWTMPSMIIAIEYGTQNPYKIIVLMTIAWMTDGFAYMCGKVFGRNKLAPDISPNKTIEGTIGGVVASVLTSHLVSYYYYEIARLDLYVLAFLCGITGQIGDLIESKFKRIFNIKDSGNLIPGHKGVLDRFDSIFTALPCAYLYLKYFI